MLQHIDVLIEMTCRLHIIIDRSSRPTVYYRSERMIGFNTVYPQCRIMYASGYQICCNWSRLKLSLMGQHTEAPKYHAADKHDTPLSHFKLTLGQPVLL